MDPVELDEADKLLRVAQLIRSSEAGFARDRHGGITQQADPDGEKLDWYSVGLLDALRVARGYDRDRLRLLTYLMLLSETGPSENARCETERLFASLHRASRARYIDAGRCTIGRLLAGERVDPGNYAELLAADVGQAEPGPDLEAERSGLALGERLLLSSAVRTSKPAEKRYVPPECSTSPLHWRRPPRR